MNAKRILLILLSLLLLPAAAAEQTPVAAPSSCGALQVINGRLSDADGNPVQLRGISTHGIAWYPDYINAENFRQFREEWNANVIRLAMYTGESGGYCADGDQAALKALIARGVQYATEADMYVIIDWHILSDNNPLTHLEAARAFFAEMSKTYSGYNNVLYEICNEPNSGTTWQDVKNYAMEIIPTIQANDPEAVILVGTPNWCQTIEDAVNDPIALDGNIMYTMHFYAATHREQLRDAMTRAALGGLPIFVSEYGICDASGNGNLDIDEANRWVETMNGLGISYINWNLSNKNESSAMLRSDCARTSGFTADDLSASGRWLYATLSGEDLPDASSASPSGAVVAQENGIVCAVQLTNQWDSNGKPFRQYTVTVQNTSDAECTQWRVQLPFDGPIEVSDGWNGGYYVENNTLWITCVGYNGTIPAGGSVGDVGFIAMGEGNLIPDAE